MLTNDTISFEQMSPAILLSDTFLQGGVKRKKKPGSPVPQKKRKSGQHSDNKNLDVTSIKQNYPRDKTEFTQGRLNKGKRKNFVKGDRTGLKGKGKKFDKDDKSGPKGKGKKFDKDKTGLKGKGKKFDKDGEAKGKKGKREGMTIQMLLKLKKKKKMRMKEKKIPKYKRKPK